MLGVARCALSATRNYKLNISVQQNMIRDQLLAESSRDSSDNAHSLYRQPPYFGGLANNQLSRSAIDVKSNNASPSASN